ncbi:MAG: methyltransferase domain-containing protein [Candidatus Hodarchaeota archaeon]
MSSMFGDEKICLNIGCGRFFRTGYINIDFFDSSIADEVMSADNLRFPDNSVEKIEAMHIIEHFNCVDIVYVLSEWFRVLRPGGTLSLETPDLERTFKLFLSTNEFEKKKLLRWIFGIDSPGMAHKSGFTFELLKELLKEAGFEGIRKKRQKTHSYAPGMRVECRKPQNYEGFQIISEFRRLLRKEASNSLLDVEIRTDYEENVMKPFIVDILRYIKGKDKIVLGEIFVKYSVYCPTAVKCFFSVLQNEDDSDKTIRFYLRKSEYLEDINFAGKLFSLWEKMKKNAGREKELFPSLILLARKSVKNLLIRFDTARKSLEAIEDLHPETKYFSKYVADSHSDKYLRLGVKLMSKGEFGKGKESLLKAFNLTPDSYIIAWNLARIYAKEVNLNLARKYYQIALSSVKEIKPKQVLSAEFERFVDSNDTPNTPIDEQGLGI